VSKARLVRQITGMNSAGIEKSWRIRQRVLREDVTVEQGKNE
jgi:hypothetical protein